MSDEDKGKQKSTLGIGASLTLDFRDKEESNNYLPGNFYECFNQLTWPWSVDWTGRSTDVG